MTLMPAPQYFEEGMWREAASLYWQKLPLILMVVTLTTAMGLINVMIGERSGFFTNFVWSVLAASVHNTLLNRSNAQLPKFIYVLGVVGAWFILSIPGTIVMLATAIYLGSSKLDAPIPTAVLGIITLLVASYLGTLIPASVRGKEDQAFGKAAARGKLVFGYTLTRLTLWICASLAASYSIDTAANWLNQMTGGGDNTLSLVNITSALASNFVAAYSFVLLAVILSRSYLRGESQKT